MSKMINSREGGKRKGKNVSEVEMVQTSDGGVFKDAQKGGLEDGYAQPKGVQTRQAIAKHLAAKLKIENDKLAAGGLHSTHYQPGSAFDSAGESRKHWERVIIRNRHATRQAFDARRRRLTST